MHPAPHARGGGRHARHGQPLALLGGLLGDAGQAGGIDPAGMLRWVKTGWISPDPKLGRLLHHPVVRIPLQRGDQQAAMSAAGACGRVWRSGSEGAAVLPQAGDAGPPFAVAAVEHRHRIARPAPHDACRGNAPGRRWRGPRPPRQGLVQVEARGGHAALSLDRSRRARLHRHQDAAAGRPAAAGLAPYALLARLDRPIGVWLLFLPGLWAFAWPRRTGRRGAADALFAHRRHRHAGGRLRGERPVGPRHRPAGGAHPRPAARRRGTVTPFQALVFLAGLCLIGLLVLVQLNPLAHRVGRWFAGADPALSAGQAGHQLAAGDARPGLLLGGAGGDRGGDRADRRGGPAALGRRLLLDPRLRHDLCPPGPGGRRAVGIGSTALRFGERTRGPSSRPATARRSGCCWRRPAGSAGLSWAVPPGLLLPAALLARQVRDARHP